MGEFAHAAATRGRHKRARSLVCAEVLRRALGRDCKLAELTGDIWTHIECVSRDCLNELVDILRRKLRLILHLDIGAGQTLAFRLHDLPLSTRTRNIVFRYSEDLSAPNLSFRDVLSIPNCGIRSTIEFACVLESGDDL